MRKRENDLEAVQRDIEERGAMIAYRTLISVCDRDDAPAQAKTAAGVAILRAAGFLDAKSRPEVEDGELVGRSAADWERRLRVLGAEVDRLEQEASTRQSLLGSAVVDGDDSVDVFA